MVYSNWENFCKGRTYTWSAQIELILTLKIIDIF